MKINKKTKLILIIIPIIALVALMSFVLANTVNNATSKITVTRDRTSVILKQQEDPKKVDVYLGMADKSSITSFQIGLNVDVGYNYDASFEWAANLNDGKEEFKDCSITEGRDSETERDLERVNIYYVGTKELNQLKDNVDVDNIKVGTITFDYEKDINGNPVSEEGSTLLIQPVGTDGSKESKEENFTKTLSVSHEVTPVTIKQDDILRTSIPGTQQSPGTSGDPSGQEPGGSGGSSSGQESGGSGGSSTNPEPGGSGSGSGTGEQGGTSSGSNQNGSGTEQGSSGNSGNAGSQDSTDNGSSTEENNNSTGDVIKNNTKTGADHSNFGIICLVVILVIVAGIIIFIKIRSKKAKH